MNSGIQAILGVRLIFHRIKNRIFPSTIFEPPTRSWGDETRKVSRNKNRHWNSKIEGLFSNEAVEKRPDDQLWLWCPLWCTFESHFLGNALKPCHLNRPGFYFAKNRIFWSIYWLSTNLTNPISLANVTYFYIFDWALPYHCYTLQTLSVPHFRNWLYCLEAPCVWTIFVET